IAMQIPNLGFEEAQHAYLRGLNAKIRDLVLTREGFTDIRSLQNACLRLDTNNKSSEEEALHSESSRGGRGGYRGRGGGNFRGRGQWRGGGVAHNVQYNQHQYNNIPSGARGGHGRGYGGSFGRGTGRITCYKCGKLGHFQMSCPENAKKSETEMAEA